MLAVVSTGQFIGSCIESLLWVGAGVYLAWIWPRRVRRDMATGKIWEEEGQAKLTKFSPLLRFLVIVVGLVRLLENFVNR